MLSSTKGVQVVCATESRHTPVPAAEGGGQDELTHLLNLEQSTCLTPLLLGHVPKASYGDNYSD